MKMISSALALAAATLMSASAAFAQDTAAPDKDKDEAERIAEIIVEGERPLSRAEITQAVAMLTRRTGLFDPVPRFTNPVCVLVTGMGEAIDNMIADRIRANITATGLPLGDNKCRPNAITIITDDPQAMYSEIRDTRPGLIGVGITPLRIGFDDLREYSKTELESQLKSGAPAVSWSTYGTDLQNQGMLQDLGAGAFWGWNSRPSFARGGRPRGNSVVLFDRKQINGVRLHQLADFATVHLLGSPRLNPGKAASDVPTILTLFDQGPSKAPQRLTVFDRAYLCGIYRLREGSLGTRIVQNMLDVYDSECVRVGAPAQ